MDWLSAIQQLRADGSPAVLVTVIETRGHAPRDAGAKMVVAADGIWGTVGGGNLEQTAVDRARELIATGATRPETLDSALNAHAHNAHGRQCCGGTVRLLLEPLPARPTVAIFGVGHVGYELGRILSRLELRLHLVDSRAQMLDPLRLADITSGVADVTVHRELLGEVVLERLPRGAQVLIMTHDHAEDFALCDAALRLSDTSGEWWGSVGLIGSRAKWGRFRRMLLEAGHEVATVDRITCPIGLPTLTSKEPAVIAIGVAAALVPALSPGLRPEPVAGASTGSARMSSTSSAHVSSMRPELVEGPSTGSDRSSAEQTT
jgi:xanthine dehydrogenase accessory factor